MTWEQEQRELQKWRGWGGVGLLHPWGHPKGMSPRLLTPGPGQLARGAGVPALSKTDPMGGPTWRCLPLLWAVSSSLLLGWGT